MSLMRQLGWLLAAVLLLALAGAMGVTLLTTRTTLEAQLRLKDSDNAQSLALALSQQRGDAASMALLLSAQFDTGFYRRIRLSDRGGQVLFERQTEAGPRDAPAWFAESLPFAVPPGVAQVSDGWRNIGQVEVISHVAYAHDALWRAALRMLVGLVALGSLAWLGAALVVRHIRRPLDATVAQAHALVEGRFVQVEEPRAPELRRLAQAMNGMVERLRSLTQAQAEQVEQLRRLAHEDALTGLAHRGHFMQRLAAALHGETGAAGGVLLLVRLADLGGLNRRLGRDASNQALQALATVLREWPDASAFAGRLNGADFALAVPAPALAVTLAPALIGRLRGVLAPLAPLGETLAVHLGAIHWQSGTEAAALLAAADQALARAEGGLPFTAEVVAGPGLLRAGEQAWHRQLGAALSEGRTRLAAYPVLGRDGALWQLECPLRIQTLPGGEFETATAWLPLAARCRLLPQIDLHAVQLALAAIAADGLPRGINLAVASLADAEFAVQLRRLLDAAPSAARSLSLELGEVAAVNRFDLLQAFGGWVRPLGVQLGLEHAGHGLQRIERLQELNLDFVKLDAALVRGVAGSAPAALHVGGCVALLHGLGVRVCAEGVDDAQDAQRLWDQGVDALTGPWAGQAMSAQCTP